MSCEHPDSTLVGIEPDICWCSRCGSLAEFNEVYEKTWRPPSLGSGAHEFAQEIP